MTAAARPRGRLMAVLGGAGLALALIAMALVFATSTSTARIAGTAQALHWANASAGSAAVARAGVAQAVVFGIDHELDVATRASVEMAVTEARSTIAQVEEWLDAIGGGGEEVVAAAAPLTDEIAAFVAAASDTVDAVAAGDARAADVTYRNEVEPDYERLSAELVAAQRRLADEIAATQRSAGTMGLLTQVMATLLIPAAAIVIYFVFMRRQYREASVRMEARLQAERELSQAKDDFIAGVSHELRTPLTGIYGFSEYLIEEGIIDPDEALELIGHINQEASELSRMVEDLLSAARLDSDALTLEITPTEVSAEVLTVAVPMQRAGATISLEGGKAHASADPIRLRQVVRNLLSNAIKHGGSHIRVSIDNGDDHVVITVADNGAGVHDKLKDRLFDRFVHDGGSSLLAGSVGLGLSIARSLARRMGGDVTYVRAVGWTNFVLALPKA
ncbi:MAG: sensor histidine kinase, partial [Actinobacteria bacterium]